MPKPLYLSRSLSAAADHLFGVRVRVPVRLTNPLHSLPKPPSLSRSLRTAADELFGSLQEAGAKHLASSPPRLTKPRDSLPEPKPLYLSRK
jgi:hypothetical protein